MYMFVMQSYEQNDVYPIKIVISYIPFSYLLEY